MNESLLEAREELKRFEHIIYVSLKYSRTVDVITNALNRLVAIFDFIIQAYLEKAQEEGHLDSLPKSPALRARKVAQFYEDDTQLLKYLEFYHHLKTILKHPEDRRKEFRRHVTRIVHLDHATSEIAIDNLMNCEKYAHRFYAYAKKNILNEPDEEE